jgi:hypothetical protein
LSYIYVTDLQSTDVLEHIEWDSTIEWELFVAFDQPGSPIGSKSEARDLGEG